MNVIQFTFNPEKIFDGAGNKPGQGG
jgi:hypothetical protein